VHADERWIHVTDAFCFCVGSTQDYTFPVWKRLPWFRSTPPAPRATLSKVLGFVFSTAPFSADE